MRTAARTADYYDAGQRASRREQRGREPSGDGRAEETAEDCREHRVKEGAEKRIRLDSALILRFGRERKTYRRAEKETDGEACGEMEETGWRHGVDNDKTTKMARSKASLSLSLSLLLPVAHVAMAAAQYSFSMAPSASLTF